MRKIPFLLVPAMVLLGACGGGAALTTPHHHAKRHAVQAYQSGGAASGTATVVTRTIKAGGKSLDALTTPSGMTLYYFTSDTPIKVACTGPCAVKWPPLRIGSSPPVRPAGLSGSLTAVKGGNGLQVEYNGHPLYTFYGDKGPGQANGQGLLGKWWVATVGLAGASSSGASGGSAGGSSSTKSGSSGSGW